MNVRSHGGDTSLTVHLACLPITDSLMGVSFVVTSSQQISQRRNVIQHTCL